MHRKELWAVLLGIVMVTAVLGFYAVQAIRNVIALGEQNAMEFSVDPLAGVTTSTWTSYSNSTYGFSLQYPPNWTLATYGLQSANPFIVLGNPLQGLKTYALYVSILQNPQDLSSAAYVHQMLADARAQDMQNAKSGPAPSVAPHYSKSYFSTVAAYPAYELYGVFEFDRNGEQIFVAHGNMVLKFDFAVSDENPNLASPGNNNAMAHMIINTLSFAH